MADFKLNPDTKLFFPDGHLSKYWEGPLLLNFSSCWEHVPFSTETGLHTTEKVGLTCEVGI